MERVAILGYSVDGFHGQVEGRGDEVIFPVVRSALEGAGLSRHDVDSVVNCGHDAYSGQTISSGMIACPSGGYEKPTVRLQNGGVYAIHQAVAQIRSDKADVVVVSAEDTVSTDTAAVSTVSQDALYNQPLGVTYLHTHGLLATEYLDRHDVTEADYAAVAAKNYRAAAANPHAHRDEHYDEDEILESDRLVSPFRELTVGPESKGAAALVVASEEVAEDVGAAAWIDGIGVASSRGRVRDVDRRLRSPSLRAAANAAYEDAGVSDPHEEVDAVELYNPMAHLELLGYEALGLCDRGEGVTLLREGTTDLDGDLPVNSSGGALGTNPLNASGLLRTIHSVMTLNDDLESAAVDDATTTVATDSDLMLGEWGRSDGVVVLGGAS
jgi:acetyl-CoA acetyltransferase